MASKSSPADQILDIEEALDYIDKSMERIKTLYEQYFLGMQKQPPSHLHNDIERRIRDLMQVQIRNTGMRYRFATLQQKFGSYNSYWRRTLRQIENGTYIRQLAKIGRRAAETGEEIPEEILAAMPKRMREQVKRDREVALAVHRRRAEAQGLEDGGTIDSTDEPALITEAGQDLGMVRNQKKLGHVVDEADADMDFDAFFESMKDGAGSDFGPDDTNPDAKPFPEPARTPAAKPAPAAATVQKPPPAPPPKQTFLPAETVPSATVIGMDDEDEATTFSAGPPAMMPPPARPTGPSPRVAAAPPGTPPQRAPSVPPAPPQRAPSVPPAPPQRQSQPMPAQPPPFAQQPTRTTGQQPVVPPQPPQRASQPIPTQPPQRQTGPVPAQPLQRASQPIPTQPSQRQTGPQPALPPPTPQRASQPIPTQPSQRQTGPVPVQPPPPPRQPSSGAYVAPPDPQPRTKFVEPGRAGTVPGVAPPPSRESGPIPVVTTNTGQHPAVPRPPTAPSQVTRPNPIQPGSSQQRSPVPVQSMQGPFPRSPGGAPRPERPEQPMRPPPGMNDADVNALYAKYVQAKHAVGDDPGPGAYGKLLKTINAQAPKIMEQYKARGVEFSVVVKDNQVIIKAKPKP